MRLLMGEDWAGPYAFDQRTRPPFVAMEKKSSIFCICIYVGRREGEGRRGGEVKVEKG